MQPQWLHPTGVRSCWGAILTTIEWDCNLSISSHPLVTVTDRMRSNDSLCCPGKRANFSNGPLVVKNPAGGEVGSGECKVAPFFKLRHVFGKFWHGALSLSLLKESSYRYVEENSFKKTNGGCSVAAARVSNPNEFGSSFQLPGGSSNPALDASEKSNWRIICRATWIAQVIFDKVFFPSQLQR
jgi:hypothetical protein